MEKKKDAEKATREAMRLIMGIDEIRSTFMTEKGAAGVKGGKKLKEDTASRISGNETRYDSNS